METPENDEHPAFAKYLAKYEVADPDNLFRIEGPPDWLRAGAAVTVDGEPVTVIRFDEELGIAEFAHGDC